MSPASSQMWEQAAPGEDHCMRVLSPVADVARWTGDTMRTFSFITRWCHPGSATEKKGSRGSRVCSCLAWVMPGDCKLEIEDSKSIALPSSLFNSASSIAAPTQLHGVGRGVALNVKTHLILTSISKDILQVKAKQQQFPLSSCQKMLGFLTVLCGDLGDALWHFSF